MSFWVLLAGFSCVLAGLLLWLWGRHASHSGQSLSAGHYLWVAAAPMLAFLGYISLGHDTQVADWLHDQQRLSPVAREIIDGKTLEELDVDIRPAALARVLQRELVHTSSAAGWWELTRLYTELGAVDMATTAARHLGAAPDAEPSGARMLLALALMQKAEGRYTDEVAALVRDVLSHNPDHDGALMLFAEGAEQRQDYVAAAGTWEKLLDRHANSTVAAMLEERLAFSRGQVARSAAFSEISVTVSGAQDLPVGGTLFVVLQDAKSGGRPLAAHRTLVSSFPVRVTLAPTDWLQPYPALERPLVLHARYTASPGGTVEDASYVSADEPFDVHRAEVPELLLYHREQSAPVPAE